jgi:hypothetical protein
LWKGNIKVHQTQEKTKAKQLLKKGEKKKRLTNFLGFPKLTLCILFFSEFREKKTTFIETFLEVHTVHSFKKSRVHHEHIFPTKSIFFSMAWASQ